ncbi:MAG: PAS domain-containing protein [Alphaproteobacteria bacterium]|nr:MAG: PAS domain-containing protein [Alphaproteobacteria bacterium]
MAKVAGRHNICHRNRETFMAAGNNEARFSFPAFATHQHIVAFFSAWRNWRGDAMVPTRSQIRLADIPHLMRGCMLLDMHGPDQIVFRYAGSLFQDLYKFDFTGANYLDITEPATRDMRSRRLMAVVEQPAAAVWTAPGVDTVDFIGASVPILADHPGQPPLLMQVCIHLKDLHHIRPATMAVGREKVEISNRFRFIDIGAGIPADESLES